jgi:anti-sigma28 factor (negative regulator of flagellin synthesis)
VRLNGSCETGSLKAYIPLIKKDRTMQKENNDSQSLRDRANVLQEAIKILSCGSMYNKKSTVREDLTTGLKKRIQDGLYNPDNEKIAAGIISEILLAQTLPDMPA